MILTHSISSMVIRRLVSSVCILAFFLPSAVYATEPPLTLKQVIDIVRQSASPQQYHMDAQFSHPGFHGSFTIVGRESGKHHSLKDYSTDLNLLFDFSSDMAGTISVKGQLRMVSGIAYVYLDSWSATGQFSEMKSTLDPFLKKWVSFPLDPSQYVATKDLKVTQSTEALQRFAKFFDITKAVSQGMTHYTVVLPARKQRSFLMAFIGATRAYTSPRANAVIRRSARSTTIDITFVVDALTSGSFSGAQGSVGLKLPYGNKPFTLSYNVSTQLMSSFAPIVAPQDSKSFRELVGLPRAEASSLSDARNAQRQADVNTLLNSVYQYAIDNNWELPPTMVQGKLLMICKTKMSCSGISLDELTNSYIVKVPVDPQQDSSSPESGYTIEVLSDGKIRVSAPKTENQESIFITR